ncbi:MAG: UbiA prenyltransferase family protein [Phycisphaerales bacterium JB058]|jgi:4-hydroxybenzoate polyprenyltransferase
MSETTENTRPTPADYLRLARPHQWGKGAFVLIGPIYSLALIDRWLPVLGAFLAFGFASSACYVINDISDRKSDALHPRKKNRPIASGRIQPGPARVYAIGLLVLASAAVFLVDPEHRWWVGGFVGVYVANVLIYSAWLKHMAMLDVVSLSVGFVLRVMAGCAAAAVAPSTWLLNSTFFLAMFLALGKRLGERRTMAGVPAEAEDIRGVHRVYTDDLLRMAVVMTAVGTLVTYAGYVEQQESNFGPSIQEVAAHQVAWGFNLLWLTILPATYGLLRCIVLLEQGRYDDPTELAVRDRGVQAAGLVFVAITAALLLARRPELLGMGS